MKTTPETGETAGGLHLEKEGKIGPTQSKVEIHGPTPTELALIAAALRRNENQDFSALASDAFFLWEKCQAEIQRQNNDSVKKQLVRRDHDLFANLPKPKAFPVPFVKFLNLILPSKGNADRLKIYRRFLADWRGVQFFETDVWLVEHKEKPAFESEYYERAFLFKAWYPIYVRNERRIAGSKTHKPTQKKLRTVEAQRRIECKQAIDNAEMKLAPKRKAWMALC